jgi:hypothetical protein
MLLDQARRIEMEMVHSSIFSPKSRSFFVLALILRLFLGHFVRSIVHRGLSTTNKRRIAMKLKVPFVVVVLLALATIGFSTTGDSGMKPTMGIIHTAPQGRAPCGLTVNVEVIVNGKTLVVRANGTPGQSCEWIGMEVSLSMRRTDNGQWTEFSGYSGPDLSWESSEHDTSNFSEFSALAVVYDTQLWELRSRHQKACLSPQEHTAGTRISGDF